MSLDAGDLPSLLRTALPVVREVLHALRLHSEGGRAITRDEARRIGERLAELGAALMRAAAA